MKRITAIALLAACRWLAMNKLLLVPCLVMVVNANAQTAPKVVFTGDSFTLAWQTTAQFTANHNWIGAGVQPGAYQGSNTVLDDFQTNVINQHPAFVHIMTGESDIDSIHDATPLGVAWSVYVQDIEQMVAMAKAANIKVVLGNVTTGDNQGTQPTQFFNEWLQSYGSANKIPVVNYHDALCQCVGWSDTYAAALSYPLPPGATIEVTGPPNDAGYALITEMAQIAIQTYGLTIKSGYLSDVETRTAFNGAQPQAQVNTVGQGEFVQFTPQAKWSDGVVRPILNQDIRGLKGTWTSSNPSVMYINQQGEALAYNTGTTTISFQSASGVVFSPWKMTVVAEY